MVTKRVALTQIKGRTEIAVKMPGTIDVGDEDSELECKDLEALREGFNLRMVEGELVLDRYAPIRRLATATIRGLAGTILIDEDSQAFHRFFKPSEHGEVPPAYLFQPLHSEEMEWDRVPFRLVTWDSEGHLMRSLMHALSGSEGFPFGESGARVKGCAWNSPAALRFSGTGFPSSACDICLSTPFNLRASSRGRICSHELTMSHLVKAAVNRINSLSTHWGNGLQLPDDTLSHDASLCTLDTHKLREVNPKRRSRTQNQSIFLNGIVGMVRVPYLDRKLANLLSVGELLHLGRHTPEGCGMIRLLYR